MGDLQTAATTALISGVCGCGRCVIPADPCIQPSPVPTPSCFFFFAPVSDGALADPPSSGPCTLSSFPLSTSATFSPRHADASGVGRWWEGKAVVGQLSQALASCQTKLPLLFSQPSPSNYGFHTRWREAEPNNRPTTLCHRHMPLGSQAQSVQRKRERCHNGKNLSLATV